MKYNPNVSLSPALTIVLQTFLNFVYQLRLFIEVNYKKKTTNYNSTAEDHFKIGITAEGGIIKKRLTGLEETAFAKE